MIFTFNKKDECEIKKIFDCNNISYELQSNDNIVTFEVFGEINEELISNFSCLQKSNEPSYYLVSREYKSEDTIIDVGNGVKFGGNEVNIIAGPCSIESLDEVDSVSSELKKQGIQVLRGGAYKMRTSPYSFQGLRNQGLLYLNEVKKKYNLIVASEITSIEEIEEFEKYVDIIQVGARNMQNFELLKALGKSNKPILLKRGLGNTIDEFLMAAEYIVFNGNKNVILCERGIRTFESKTRFTLDISAVALIKKLSHLPIVVDPSHAAGISEIVCDLAKAAVACGADGLLIEANNMNHVLYSDAMQTISMSELKRVKEECGKIAKALGKEIK